MIRATAYRLIDDCRQWEATIGEDTVPERFAELSKAMLRVARYIRTGALTND